MQLQNHQEQLLILYRGLKQTFADGKMKKELYQEEIDRCWAKRAKLVAEDLTICRQRERLLKGLDAEKEGEDVPDWPAAYAALVTNHYKNNERPAAWEARNEHKHGFWRQGLIEYYNAEDNEDNDFLWCPIMRKYNGSENRNAAHIVPHSIGYSSAGHLFGEPNVGFDLIWSVRNGLLITSVLERQFDKGYFVLVPVEPADPNTEPFGWRFILMNEKLRNYPVGDSSTKYDDLDGRELEWKNDNRPARRYLYYHFVTTLLRYVRYEKPGWAGTRLTLPTGKLWATQGRYLRRSTLKYLASAIGDVDEADEIFADGVFDGKDDKPEKEERLMAQEIFVRQERAELEEEDVWIETEEQEEDVQIETEEKDVDEPKKEH